MQPQENPAKVLLGLHGNSTEWFFLEKLYGLECTRRTSKEEKKHVINVYGKVLEDEELLYIECFHYFLLNSQSRTSESILPRMKNTSKCMSK